MSTTATARVRPGLTLVETLVALVLLSGVATATAALLRSVSDVHTSTTPELRWMSHAERALMCVSDDLLIGDRIEREQGATSVNGAFILTSRSETSGGRIARVRIRYNLDDGSGRLIRNVQAVDDRGRPSGPVTSRTLLGDIESFLIEPIELTDEQQDRSANEPPIAYRLEIRSGELSISRVVRP